MKPKQPPEVVNFFKLPPAVLAFFQKTGAEGGKIGGKRSLETMTAEQRTARAKKAVAAREAKRASPESSKAKKSASKKPK